VSAGFSFSRQMLAQNGEIETSRIHCRVCEVLDHVATEREQAAGLLKKFAMLDTALQGEPKIVSNETCLKKFLLNFICLRGPRAGRALLSPSGCDNILRSDPPQSRPNYTSRSLQNK